MDKVLHITTPMTWRGGERQVFYLIEGLKKQRIKQFVLCAKGGSFSKKLKDVEVYELPSLKIKNFLKWVKQIKKICEDEKINIVHVHESRSHTLAILSVVLFSAKIKIVVTRRVLFPVTGLLSKFKYNHKSISEIICISTAVEVSLRESGIKFKGIIIPSSIDCEKYNNPIITDYNLILKKFKVAYVAACTFEKDHETFLQVAKKITSTRDDIVFYIAGNGKLQKKITSRIAELNLTSVVKEMGFLENIDDFIRQVDGLLFTSVSEGFGSTLLDFFLAKKIVVSTRNGGSQDIITNGNTGYLCDVKDVDDLVCVLNKVVDQPEIRKEIENNAYLKVIRDYNIHKMAQDTYAVYLLVDKAVFV